MTDYTKKLLPRFRYGVIHPRAHEDVQRGPCYQLYRLLPNDFMEVATGLGLENYTQEGVDKAIQNYWSCVDRLVKEKVDHIVLSGAPISAVLTRPRVLQFIRETKEKYGIPVDCTARSLDRSAASTSALVSSPSAAAGRTQSTMRSCVT